jgi:hypothetical protein
MVELETFKPKRRLKRPRPVTCVTCGGLGVLAEKGPNNVPAWLCEAYPGCDSYVGVHPGTTLALGTMAGPELRAERLKTHRWMDRLWRGKVSPTRKEVYQLVGKVLGIRQFHVAQADLPLLKKLTLRRAAIERAFGNTTTPARPPRRKPTGVGRLPVSELVSAIDTQLLAALFAGRRRRLWPKDSGGQAAAERGLLIGAVSLSLDAAGRTWVQNLHCAQTVESAAPC